MPWFVWFLLGFAAGRARFVETEPGRVRVGPYPPPVETVPAVGKENPR